MSSALITKERKPSLSTVDSEEKYFEDLRAREFGRVDGNRQTYLDYVGGGLYPESLIREHVEMLTSGVFGNPHSVNPSSLRSTQLVEDTRKQVLAFFNADPAEYDVIFTPNASGALKLVGESYPFSTGRWLKRRGRFVLVKDTHNSVNGIREFARLHGVKAKYITLSYPDLYCNEEKLFRELDQPKAGANNLFAFAAQSNWSGIQHPMSYIEEAKKRGWDVLVDCAAFVPTNKLDLGRVKPDYVPISFYKMFGYPTGLGCLIARKEALAKLRRPWFSGGTIWGIGVNAQFHYFVDGPGAFEDGTVNYLGIPAIGMGLEFLSSIGMDEIHAHVMRLTRILIDELTSLRHKDGRPVVEIYGSTDLSRRGGTVTFNFVDPTGKWIDERVVERDTTKNGISVRTGCFCNPGASEEAWDITAAKYDRMAPKGWKLLKTLLYGHDPKGDHLSFDDLLEKIDLIAKGGGGGVRVSLGLPSVRADIDNLIEYARAVVIDRSPDATNLRKRLGC